MAYRHTQALNQALQRALDDQRAVGAVLLVAQAGTLVYQRAVGWADREMQVPMRLDAQFRIASLSKPIMSIVALSLIERGALALDDPVTRFLPAFRPAMADGTRPTITIGHLLTHTSGLGYGFLDEERPLYDAAGVSNGLDQPGLGFDENARRLASVPLFSAPGVAYRYSLSTDVLGEALARAAGSPLPQLISLVTTPLNLTETSFGVTAPARLVVPYGDGRPRPVRMDDGHVVQFPGGATRFAPSRVFDGRSYPSAGSGLTSTARDYLAVLEAIRTDDARLLPARWFREMKQDQIALAARATTIPGAGWGSGFGLDILVDPVAADLPLPAGAYRFQGAYGHSFFVDPGRELTVLLLTNTAIEGMFGTLPLDIKRALYI